MNATPVNGKNEITLKVSADDDLIKAVRGIAWEVTNALNNPRLEALRQKAKEGAITKEEYIYGICRVEADAQLNRDIIGIQLGYIKLAENQSIDWKKLSNDVEYAKLADNIAKDIQENGINGQGKSHKVAYGEQYDALVRQGYYESFQKTLEENLKREEEAPYEAPIIP